jgi:hypothetical protein
VSAPWLRAISVRQPCAWAVIHAGKDVENRSEHAARAYSKTVGSRVYIHAANHRMTRAEYADAVEFMAGLGVEPTARDGLRFGGVIGSVLVTGIVTRHRSQWFRGPAALVLADPRPELFTPVRGQIGPFRVQLRQARP